MSPGATTGNIIATTRRGTATHKYPSRLSSFSTSLSTRSSLSFKKSFGTWHGLLLFFPQKSPGQQNGCFPALCPFTQNPRSIYRTSKVMHVRRMIEKRRRTGRCVSKSCYRNKSWACPFLEILTKSIESRLTCRHLRCRDKCITQHKTLILKCVSVVQNATQRWPSHSDGSVKLVRFAMLHDVHLVRLRSCNKRNCRVCLYCWRAMCLL